MKKKWRGCLVLAVVVVLVLTMISLDKSRIVNAASPDIGQESYVDDGMGGMNYDIRAGDYGTITVPAGYHLTISNVSVTADNLVLGVAATVHIIDGGELACGSIQAAEGTPEDPGAFIELENNSNTPLVQSVALELYDYLPNPETGQDVLVNVNGDPEWRWFTFEYVSGENKWIRVPDEPQGPEEEQLNWERLQQELDATEFAFGDIDKSGATDDNDMKYGVSRILCGDFKAGEGRYQREGLALGLIRDDGQNTDTNIQKIMDLARVEQVAGEKITVKDKNDNEKYLDKYKITYTIPSLYEYPDGEDNEPRIVALEDPIVFSAYVYKIDTTNFPGTADNASWEQVIFRVGDKYFIRDCYSEGNGNENDLKDFEGMNARAIILVADYNKKEDISVFGNYAQMNEEFSDASSESFFAAGFGTHEEGVPYLGDKFVVYKPSFKGVTIKGDGETAKPLAWSETGSFSVADSGEHTETSLFFGYSKAVLNAITSREVEGLSVQKIASAKILGGIPEEAVSVTQPDAGGNVEVSFHSDFYDSVPVELTYLMAGGSQQTGVTTINRVGIVVQGGRSAGDSHKVQIMHGHDSGEVIGGAGEQYDVAVYATYYYPSSSGATEASVSLFVTLTYADGSVERKVIPSTYFKGQEGGNTAMSDYVIYCGDADGAPVTVDAIAVPNADANGRYEGAKLGAGKGVNFTVTLD